MLFASCLACAAEPITLPEGTPIALRLPETVVSGSQKEGQQIELECVDTVIAPTGEILVRPGAKALGTITKSKKAGLGGKRGDLAFTVEKVEVADGTLVPVRWTTTRRGGGTEGAGAAAGFIGGGLIGAAIGAALSPGQDVVVPAGVEFVVYTAQAEPVQAAAPPTPALMPAQIVGEATVLVGEAGGTGDRKVIAVFSVKNPNDSVGLRRAHVTVTATSTGVDPDTWTNVPPVARLLAHGAYKRFRFLDVGSQDPNQAIPYLAPGGTGVYVKQLTLVRKPKAEAKPPATPDEPKPEAAEAPPKDQGPRVPTEYEVHVAQNWVSAEFLKEAATVTCTFVSPATVDAKNASVVGQVKNDGQQQAPIEFTAVITKDGKVIGAARQVTKGVVKPGATVKFTLPIVGSCDGTLDCRATATFWAVK